MGRSQLDGVLRLGQSLISCTPVPEIEARIEDITTAQVDAIVNAANSHLQHGGGVARAIATAAGPELVAESDQAPFVPTGQVLATSAGDLPCAHVIHAVGPIWSGGSKDEPELLASAYRTSLLLASELGCRSVAFPSISTGIFGFPLERAAPIAVGTVRATLETAANIDLVRFCLFSDEDLAAYERVLTSAS